jgi:hypothetical protein
MIVAIADANTVMTILMIPMIVILLLLIVASVVANDVVSVLVMGMRRSGVLVLLIRILRLIYRRDLMIREGRRVMILLRRRLRSF